MKITAISGSLRRASFNTALLRTCIELAPADMDISLADISAVPLYNGDDQSTGFPAAVTGLGDQIRAADAVLIATPEYNYSIPGVLKNTIDWLSRVENQPFEGKPVGIMGAAMGALEVALAVRCRPTERAAHMSEQARCRERCRDRGHIDGDVARLAA